MNEPKTPAAPVQIQIELDPELDPALFRLGLGSR